MALRLLYFARLREDLNLAEEQLDFDTRAKSVGALLTLLRQRDAKWASTLSADRPFRVAVNQNLADAATPLSDGDEVAFFPPVTGG